MSEWNAMLSLVERQPTVDLFVHIGLSHLFNISCTTMRYSLNLPVRLYCYLVNFEYKTSALNLSVIKGFVIKNSLPAMICMVARLKNNT